MPFERALVALIRKHLPYFEDHGRVFFKKAPIVITKWDFLTSVAMFEENFRESMTGTIYFETVSDAYRDYKEFCMDAGHSKPLGRNNFSKWMEALGFEKSKKEGGITLEKHY